MALAEGVLIKVIPLYPPSTPPHLMANNKLEQPVLRSQDEIEALFNEAEKGAVSGFPVLAVVIGIIVIIAAGATFFLARARKK